jgi:hypothetical protein
MQRQAILFLAPQVDSIYAQEITTPDEMIENFKASLALFHITKQDLRFALGVSFDDVTGELIQICTHTGKIFDIPRRKNETVGLADGQKQEAGEEGAASRGCCNPT